MQHTTIQSLFDELYSAHHTKWTSQAHGGAEYRMYIKPNKDNGHTEFIKSLCSNVKSKKIRYSDIVYSANTNISLNRFFYENCHLRPSEFAFRHFSVLLALTYVKRGSGPDATVRPIRSSSRTSTWYLYCNYILRHLLLHLAGSSPVL